MKVLNLGTQLQACFPRQTVVPVQFFITCSKCDWLDGKHVVFGKISDGLLVTRKIENVPTGPNNKHKLPAVISQCGEMCSPEQD